MLQETIQWRFVKIKVFHYLFCISLAYSYYRSFLSRKFLDEPSDSENRILMLGKTQINLVFRSLNRTIATRKILTLGNKNKSFSLFILYFAR